jgi:hypothetical protein
VTLRRFAILAVVAICLGGPIVEMFDRWDHTLQDGNDTEANAVVIALCVGVTFAVAGAVVARLRVAAGLGRTFVAGSVFIPAVSPSSAISRPVPTSSPPLTRLRV